MCSPEFDTMTNGGYVPQSFQEVEFDLAQIIALRKLGNLHREGIKNGIKFEYPEVFEEVSNLHTPLEVYRYFRSLARRRVQPNR